MIITNATTADLKAALAYLGAMREQCLNEDGEEIPGNVTAAMLVASAKLPPSQFSVLVELVAQARKTSDWEPGYLTGDHDPETGDHGLTPDGSEWHWTINAKAREGEPLSMSIERDGEDFLVRLQVLGPTEADGFRAILTGAKARISRADLIKLLGI